MGIIGAFIDGFIEGFTGETVSSSPQEDNTQAVAAPVQEYQVNVQRQVTFNSTGVISTMEDMQSFLSELERNCVSTAVTAKAAIQSQLLVINSIQSPTLVDTAFDTLVLNLRKTLKAADELEREEIRETYALMIQNYVFFMDAKYQAKVKADKEATRALLEQAGAQLSRSVGQVACIATGIPCGGLEIENVFDEEQEHMSLFSRILRWWNKEQDMAESEDAFMKSMYNIIRKLDKYHDVIGPSMLIAGIVDRYKVMLAEYQYAGPYAEAQKLADDYTPGAQASVWFASPVMTTVIFVLTSLITLICWAFNGTYVKELKHWDFQFPVKVALVGLGLTFLVELRSVLSASKKRNAYRSALEEQKATMNQIRADYGSMIQEFDRIQQFFEEDI